MIMLMGIDLIGNLCGPYTDVTEIPATGNIIIYDMTKEEQRNYVIDYIEIHHHNIGSQKAINNMIAIIEYLEKQLRIEESLLN